MAQDHAETLAALHRLVQREILTLDEARTAVRLIAGPEAEFPPQPHAKAEGPSTILPTS